MPFSSNTDLPESVKNVLPAEAQNVWRNAFNSAVYDQELSEDRAAEVAWGAVESAGFEKSEDGWTKKENEGAGLLAAISLANIGTDTLDQPVRVRVNALGRWVHPITGKFDVTEDDVKMAVQNFKQRQNPIAVDYEHQTYQQPPVEAPAAGWVSDIVDLGRGVFEYVISFTKRAAEKVRSGEYKFLSPVLFRGRDRNTGKPIGMVFGVPALTNDPFFFNEQQPIKLNFGITKENVMNNFLKTLFATLGITAADDVTEEKAIELVKGKLQSGDKMVASKGVLEALDLPETATEAEVKGKILALKNPGNTVPREEFEALKAKLHEKEIEDSVEKAITIEGKLYPHQRDWAMAEAKKDLPAFKAFLSNLQKVVPLGEKLPDKQEEAARIDEGQAAINRQLGVSPELFAKYNAK